MPTPVVDLLKDDSDLTMHTHTEADLGATLDNRYVNVTGDTMTGNLILNDNVSVLLGTGSDGELFHDGSNTYFQNNTGGIIIENDASDGDITFKVNDGGVDTTVMTLDGATGNVGIGTTNPGAKLDVWGASGGTSPAIFRQSDGGGGVAINAVSSYGGMSIGSYWNGSAWVATDTAAVSLNKAPAGDLGFYANSGLTSGNSYTPTIRFNVGTGGVSVYGDTNSSAKGPFYISGTASGLYGVGFNLDSSAQSNGKNYSIMSGAGSSYLPGGFAIYSSTDNAYRFSISSTGNVGIGSIGGSGQSAGSLLSVKGGASVGSSYFLNTAPTNGLIVEGNVGIGTTSPGAKLDVTDGHIRVKSLNLSNAFSQYRNDGPNLLNIDNEGQLDGGIRGYVRINDNLSLSAGKWLQLGAGSLTFYGSGNDSKISHGSQFDGTTWARSFNNYLTNVNFLSSIAGTSIFFQSTDANSGTPSFSNRMRFYVDGAGTKGGQLTIGDGSDPVANLDVNIQDASTIGQVIKGATSQAANLQEWRNSSGTGLVVVTNAGNVGIGTTSPSGRLHINGTADDEQLIVEAHSTQTNNIVEIHDSSSNVLISFNGVGGAVFNEQGSATADFRVESDTEANMLFVDANANTDGSVYLGGTTNGIEIKKGGDLTLLGTAKYERHVQIPAMANGLPANQPAEVDFFTAGGLQFASAGAQYAYCQWEIPDDWDGTDVVFEVDWFPDSGAISGTDTIKWDVEYRSIAEGEAINNGTSVTVSVTDSTDYAQYITKHSRFTLTYNNANQPLVNQDHIYFKISRDTSVANDFAGTVTVAAYEIIYQSKGFPSSN